MIDYVRTVVAVFSAVFVDVDAADAPLKRNDGDGSYQFELERLAMTFLRRIILLWPILCMPVALGACGSSSSNSLPGEMLGQWYFLGSSGGIDGDRGIDAATGYIVLHEGRMDVYDEDGGLVRRETFSPSRGKTVYSEEDLWILNFEGGEARVVLVSSDGQQMSLSPNAYDSIGEDYSRTR